MTKCKSDEELLEEIEELLKRIKVVRADAIKYKQQECVDSLNESEQRLLTMKKLIAIKRGVNNENCRKYDSSK